MESNNFESNKTVLLTGRNKVKDLTDSDKWEFDYAGGKRRQRRFGAQTGGHGAQKPRYKDHR